MGLTWLRSFFDSSFAPVFFFSIFDASKEREERCSLTIGREKQEKTRFFSRVGKHESELLPSFLAHQGSNTSLCFQPSWSREEKGRNKAGKGPHRASFFPFCFIFFGRWRRRRRRGPRQPRRLSSSRSPALAAASVAAAAEAQAPCSLPHCRRHRLRHHFSKP